MRRVFLALCALAICVSATYGDEEAAALGVLERLIGSKSASFVLTVDSTLQVTGTPPSKYSVDSFRVAASNGRVHVNATSGVALAAGAYWYLKNVTGCQVTWGENRTGDQLNLPVTLPDVAPTAVQSIVPLRYAWNMCTFDYSAVWWDLDRWTREIDWMALHGINMPLALIGQEYVWMKVFARMGIELSDLESWFTGPAFLAWQRAGNIRQFAGPLSAPFLTAQRDLQVAILAQMRALGMKPVLPCFSGHVPRAIARVYPNATLTQSPPWNNFPYQETGVYMMDPTQPEFVELGQRFMAGIIDEYGNSPFYSCDTFNEVDPTSTDPTYLADSAKSVVESIRGVDPQGVWVMQAWLFHFGFWTPNLVEAYLSGAPNDAMIILDLNSEAGPLAPQFNQYYGKPWVWNMLHNYGGVRGMYGNLTCIATGPLQSLQAPNSTMIGIGFTPEAIEQNPVMYELLTSTFWASEPIDVTVWLRDYVTQRYGGESAWALTAWDFLVNAVYNQAGEPRTELEKLPTWQQPNFGWQYGTPANMTLAFDAMIQAALAMPDDASVNGPFQYDFVDVGRQANTMFFTDVHRVLTNIFTKAWYSGDNLNNTLAEPAASTLLNLITGLDELLGTNPNYLLGMWTTRATNLGTSANESTLFMYNARNQITLWGPDGQITDYAAKAWHGLYGEYYFGRWKMLIDTVFQQGVQEWTQWTYQSQVLQWEQQWVANSSAFSSKPTGRSALSIAQELKANMTGNLTQFTAHVGFGGGNPSGQYQPMWTRAPEQLAKLCDLDPDCEGFDTNGFLRTNIVGLMPTGGVTTYVKNFQRTGHAKRLQPRKKVQPRP
jgi:alpha-N-acetylglucosaminidase